MQSLVAHAYRSNSEALGVDAIVRKYVPEPVVSFLIAQGMQIVPMRPRDRYADVSPFLRRLAVGVDAWPAPPAGLFVVDEKTCYLRSTSPMTVIHELGHAFDTALGNGRYYSTTDPEIRSDFASVREFLTPYQASAIDEYMAEAFRGFVGANDAASLWADATPERLRKMQPFMYDFFERTFAAIAAGTIAAVGA